MALFVFHKETKPIKYTMTIIRLIVMEAYKNFNAMDFYRKYVNRKYAIKRHILNIMKICKISVHFYHYFFRNYGLNNLSLKNTIITGFKTCKVFNYSPL